MSGYCYAQKRVNDNEACMRQATKDDQSAYFLLCIIEQVAMHMRHTHYEMSDPSTDGFW
jgi:hypothetical protein